ncbi:MAG: hypothetical protein ABSG81_01115 [Acidimicrobiales bacterium]
MVLGLAVLGGLVVLAVAGVSGATAVLITAAALLAMIALGNILGGRKTPDRAPYRPGAATALVSEGDAPGEGTSEGPPAQGLAAPGPAAQGPVAQGPAHEGGAAGAGGGSDRGGAVAEP